MNRRAQIFLIMTVLVISFMVSISTVLLEVQRSNYVVSVPDSTLVLQAWENTYSSIEQILLVQLSINSLGPSVDQPNINLDAQLTRIETVLNERALSAVVQSTGTIDYTIVGDLTVDTTVRIIGSFYVHIESGDVEIDQNFDLDISYHAIFGAGNSVILSRTINTDITYLSGAGLSSNNGAFTYQDGMNGNYITQNLVGGDTVTVLTTDQIDLQLTV